MANIIAAHVLKESAPSLLNRGEDGTAKECIVGGIRRARTSGQCIKKILRDFDKQPEIRSAHLEDIVYKVLKKECGDFEDDKFNYLGEFICKELLGIKTWKKHSENKQTESSDGGNVIVTNAEELHALIYTPIQVYKDYLSKINNQTTTENAAEENRVAANSNTPTTVSDATETNTKTASKGSKKKADKKISIEAEMKKRAEEELNNIRVTIAQAADGKFAASGVTGTIDGAISVADSISIDELRKTTDFWTATYTGRFENLAAEDPFYGLLTDFDTEQKSRFGSETMGESELHSNVQYRYMSANLDSFKEELMKRLPWSHDEMVSTVSDCISNRVAGLAIADPTGEQHRHASCVQPAILLVEIIKNGNQSMIDWNKVIRQTVTKSIDELGIEHMADYAKDDSFVLCDEIRRYVLLRGDRNQYEELFKNNGVTVVKNILEMKNIIEKEVANLM